MLLYSKLSHKADVVNKENKGENLGFSMLMNQHISMVVIMVTWRADAISDRTVEESTRPGLGQLDITEQVAKIKKPTSQ